MITYAELWAAVYRRKAEFDEGKDFTDPSYCTICGAPATGRCALPEDREGECPREQ